MADPLMVIWHDGEFIPPLPYILSLVPSSMPIAGQTATQPAVEVRNGTYRYLRAQLYENLPVWYEQQPALTATTTSAGAVASLFQLAFGMDQMVEPRKAFVLELGVLSDKEGKRRWALEHGFVGRYRMEIVGPSLNTALPFLAEGSLEWAFPTHIIPETYTVDHAGGISPGSMWLNLWAATLTTEIVLGLLGMVGDFGTIRNGPVAGLQAESSFERVKTFVGTIIDAIKGVIYTLEALTGGNPGQSAVIGVTNTLNALADGISNPNSMPTQALRTKFFSLQTMLNSIGAAGFPSRLKFWAGFIEFSATLGTLMLANPLDNYLIDVPIRYETYIRPLLAELTTMVTGRLAAELEVAWLERMPGTSTEGVERHLHTLNHRFAAMAQINQEQGPYGHSGPTLALTHIVRLGGGGEEMPLPIELYFRCIESSPDGKRVIRPEAWPPEYEDGPVYLTFDNGLGKLFVGAQQGTGELSIRALNTSQYFAYEANRRLTEVRVPVTVTPAHVQVDLQAGLSLELGERAEAYLAAGLPDGTIFLAENGFWADLDVLSDGTQLVLRDIWVEMPDRWTDDVVVVKLPFDLLLHLETEDDERRVSFNLPEPDSMSLGTNLHYPSLGALLQGRKSGDSTLRAVVLMHDDAPEGLSDPLVAPECAITVEPAALQLALRSEDGPYDDELTLEDRMVGDDLVGTFSVEVTAGGRTLYDSTAEALLEGHAGPAELVVERIWVEDESGDLSRLPFELHATLDTASVARFTLAHTALGSGVSGTFHTWGILENLVKAVQPGEARLTVEAILPDDEEALDVVYDLDDDSVAELDIDVPEPLSAEIKTWLDDSRPAVSLGQTPAEIIYGAGTLTGQIGNYRASSDAQEIELGVDGPGGSTVRYLRHPDHDEEPGALSSNGSWELALSDLDQGDNVLTLQAWKPIHDVLDLPPAEHARTLRGVPPRDLAIPSHENGAVVYRREIGVVTVQHARSIEARLEVTGPTGVVTMYFDGSYDLVTQDTPSPVVLGTGLGDHGLRLRVENDFGYEEQTVYLTAGAPELTPPGLPNRVGFHTETLELSAGLSGATGYAVFVNGDTVRQVADLSPESSYNLNFAVDLDVGSNVIRVEAWNAFCEADPIVYQGVVNRKDNLLSVLSIDYEVRLTDVNDPDRRLAVTIDIPTGTQSFGFDTVETIIPLSFPPTGDYTPAQWQNLHSNVTLFERDDDDTAWVQATYPFRIMHAGIVEDQDLNVLALVMRIPATHLVDNIEPVSVPGESGIFSTDAILEYPDETEINFVLVNL